MTRETDENGSKILFLKSGFLFHLRTDRDANQKAVHIARYMELTSLLDKVSRTLGCFSV